jgi:hypothetical protein
MLTTFLNGGLLVPRLKGSDLDTYELIFETSELAEDVEDAIYEAFDALVSQRGRDSFVTLSAEGESAFEAAAAAIAGLQALGAEVRRMTEDLVTRANIAERAGVTTQAVGLWVRNERHQEDPFPAPYNHVAGGVWLWSEVNDWLARGHGAADGLRHPSRDDYAQVNAALAQSRHAVPVSVGTWGVMAHLLGSAASVYPRGVVIDQHHWAGGIRADMVVAGVVQPSLDASWRKFELAG